MFQEKESSGQEPEMNHHEELDVYWEKSAGNRLVQALESGRPLADALSDLPGFIEAFSAPLDTLDCSDGRVCSGHKMGLAGEGILLSEEEKAILKQAIRERGLAITGHDNCGAAALFHPGPDSDRYGYEQARQLADETGANYSEVHREDFLCPVHNERALVLEGTGCFDCANWEEFPAQFISSAPALGLPDSYTKKEVAALSNIALGDHGFGERFNAEHPFYVIVAARNEEQLNNLLAVAREAVSEFGERVKVEGFVAPLKS